MSAWSRESSRKQPKQGPQNLNTLIDSDIKDNMQENVGLDN